MPSKGILIFSIITMAFVTTASACGGKTQYKMCCIADYDLVIPITVCVPIAELPNCVTPADDKVGTYFVTCCNTKSSFDQTCYDGVCTETLPGVTCSWGLHKRADADVPMLSD